LILFIVKHLNVASVFKEPGSSLKVKPHFRIKRDTVTF